MQANQKIKLDRPLILADGQVLPQEMKLEGMDGEMDFSREEGKLYFDGQQDHGLAAASTPSLEDAPPSFSFAVQEPQGELSPPPDSPTDLEKYRRWDNTEHAQAEGLSKNKDAEGRFKPDILWKRESDDQEGIGKRYGMTNKENGQTEMPSFNPGHYKAQTKSFYGGLTPSMKKILMTKQDERTEEELEVLKRIVDGLKCFEKYSTKVRHEMARVLEYDSSENGNVITNQGHIGISFYFILSGSVRVTQETTDKNTGASQCHCIGELTQGRTFGELALLNIKETVTIVCKGHSEFLRVDKDDFDTVLRRNNEYEYNQSVAWLKAFPLLSNIKHEEIAAIANNCKTVEYPTDKVIIGNTKGIPESVYLINSGTANVVRQISLLREQVDHGKQRFHIPGKIRPSHVAGMQEARSKTSTLKSLGSNMIKERHLMSLCTLRKGSYFGVGEDLTDTFVVAAERIEIIMVPMVLLVKYGAPKMVERMRMDWETVLPDKTSTLNVYIRAERWRAYKREVVEEVVSKKKSICNTRIEDVPLSIRISSGHADVS